MLNINPKMLPPLDEIEGIDLTLTFLRQKREESQRLARIVPVNLGMPGLRPPGREPRSGAYRGVSTQNS